MHVLAKILYLAGMCEFDVFNCDFTVVYKTMLRTRLLCVCVCVCGYAVISCLVCFPKFATDSSRH